MTQVYFVGYVEYKPTHFHAEFEVRGHHTLPERAQVDWDTLKAFRIPPPDFPDLYKWRRMRLQRRFEISKMLHQLGFHK